ncbi:MAG TPA: amidohydrolase family protein [Acidimicrobiales bacterium]|nr:amidohydrolase family protein [Acidimicrobiales bacterium]
MTDRLLFRGGTVVSMDDRLGPLPTGDVLVENEHIAAVAAALGPVDAEVIDTAGMIVAPGLVDTHRHTWQTQLRGLCADWTLTDDFSGIRLTASPCYQPDDVELGTRAGALEALDAGVTTILDVSHCRNTPDHADGAVEGLLRSGIRAVHCDGFFESVPLASRFGDHAARRRDFARLARSAAFGDRSDPTRSMCTPTPWAKSTGRPWRQPGPRSRPRPRRNCPWAWAGWPSPRAGPTGSPPP